MAVLVLVEPGVITQRRLPDRFLAVEVVIGIVSQFAENALDFLGASPLHVLLGKAIEQFDQSRMLLVDERNAGFQVAVPGEDFERLGGAGHE